MKLALMISVSLLNIFKSTPFQLTAQQNYGGPNSTHKTNTSSSSPSFAANKPTHSHGPRNERLGTTLEQTKGRNLS